jgi:hypothetical protein
MTPVVFVNNVDFKHCATLPAHKKRLSVVDRGSWEVFSFRAH